MITFSHICPKSNFQSHICSDTISSRIHSIRLNIYHSVPPVPFLIFQDQRNSFNVQLGKPNQQPGTINEENCWLSYLLSFSFSVCLNLKEENKEMYPFSNTFPPVFLISFRSHDTHQAHAISIMWISFHIEHDFMNNLI